MRLVLLAWLLLMGISHVFTSPIADGADANLVRPSDWNSAHAYTLQDAVSLSGNTAGVLANISTGTLYLAGGNNVTLSQNGNSVTLSGPHTSQFLTTAMASNRGTDFVQATAAFAGTSASGTIASNGISVSIGPYLTTAMASNRGSDFVAASAAFAGTSASGTIASNGISVSIGPYLTTAALSNHSHGNPTLALTNLSGTTASASNGFTLSLSAGAAGGGVVSNAIQQVSSATGSGTNTSRFAADDHVHAGVYHCGVSNDAGNTAGDTRVSFGRFVLRGGNNITLSQITAANELNTIVVSAANAGAGNPISYFNWPEVLANSSAVQVSGSSKYVQPIEVPFDLSVSFMRLPLSLSCIGSMASIATSANHTVGLTVSSTIQLAFYSLGTGANSLSLQSYYTTSTLWLQQATIGAAGTGSHWSSGHTISYPNNSGANTSFTSSAATTLTNRTIQSSQLSDFTALRFFHVPMATSFSGGMYWMAYNSSTSLSTSGNANISTLRILASNHAVSQPAMSMNVMGAATNSSWCYPIGAGSWSTNSIGTTTGSMQLAALSQVASNPIIHFDMIRMA